MALKQSAKYWLFLAVFWMGFIFFMSTDLFSSQNTSQVIEPVLRLLLPGISPRGIEVIHGLIRKCAHVGEYFILGLFLFRAFHSGPMELRVWRSAFFALLAVVLYAASDEFHQSFVSTRTASIIDVGFDSIGGIMAQAVSVVWQRRGNRRR